jgi:hypothetical protein
MFLFLAVSVQIGDVITENMQYSYTLEKFHIRFYRNNMKCEEHLHAPVLRFLNFVESIKKPDITDKTMQSMVGKNTFDISKIIYACCISHRNSKQCFQHHYNKVSNIMQLRS